ncbi:hypothetical protein Lsed01_00832 [Demequina sediminis]|uniref:Uncharacterized protein n=1 Tax=Demequina sediminis TaxID=1930058 RepID=A0ABP9WF35_9MICO|nr:hypothetical protein [Demequina sediminis]BDZ62514.1 hypothetical protein GCM10025873_23050 [Demequina sediminis]
MPVSTIPATVAYLLAESHNVHVNHPNGKRTTLRVALSLWNHGEPIREFTEADAAMFDIPVSRVNATIRAYNLSRFGLEVVD